MTSLSQEATPDVEALNPAFIEVDHFNFWYGPKQVLFDIHMDIPEREITALIAAQRAYEMNSKIISAADEMLRNAAQVRAARQIIEGLGREVATPDEAREILQLKGGDQVNF